MTQCPDCGAPCVEDVADGVDLVAVLAVIVVYVLGMGLTLGGAMWLGLA